MLSKHKINIRLGSHTYDLVPPFNENFSLRCSEEEGYYGKQKV